MPGQSCGKTVYWEPPRFNFQNLHSAKCDVKTHNTNHKIYCVAGCKPLKTTLVSTLLTAGIILPFVWCFLTLMLHCCWGTRLPLITLLFSGVTVSDSAWKPAQGVDFYLYYVAVNRPAYNLKLFQKTFIEGSLRTFWSPLLYLKWNTQSFEWI